MQISAVICTYNRCDLARLAVQSLINQTLPPDQYEIILVDDGSPDRTPDLAAEFEVRFRGFRYVRQSNQGLSAARNTGWKAARTPLIAYLDDDATAVDNWLELYVALFRRARATVGLAGGPVGLRWEAPRPDWLPDRELRWLGHYELTNVETTSAEDGLFIGGNMTMRSEVLERTGGFSVALGRKGTSLLSHEESALWEAARALGYTNVYLPAAGIEHFAPIARLNQKWFRRRLFWEGISMARRETARNGRSTLRLWLYAFRHFIVRLTEKQTRKLLFQPWRWKREFTWQCHFSYQMGYSRGLLMS